MIRIDYNYTDTYTPATSISNTLTAGTTGLDETTLTITNKSYENITDIIYEVQNAGTYNIVFNNCLFYKCSTVFKTILSFGSLTFNSCCFIECTNIVDTFEVLGSTINLNSCIVYNSLFFTTACNITMDKSLYTAFYGYTGNLIITDSVSDNPLFLYEIDSSFDIGVLMSKSRGYQFDSSALTENNPTWTIDAGCYIETRGTKSTTNETINYDIICDSYKKQIYLPDFKKFVNENGELIQFWNYDKEQKYINIAWSKNGMNETEMNSIITMQKMKNTAVRFYPDHSDLTKYVDGTLNKVDRIEINKNNNLFYENGNNGINLVKYKGIILSILVNSEVGSWQ